jgi:sugar lactone lactonase YvrE
MLNRTLIAALLASAAFAGAAQAQTVAALVGDDTLAMVDVKAAKVTKSMKISGASGKIVGIDVRPADGMLYALAVDGTLYTVDATGKATQKSKLEKTLADGVMGTVDFNPVADRLRVIGSDGTNLRVNVDDGKVTTDGKLAFAEKDMHKGEMPKIVAGAYTNSMKGAKETVLFDIDATIGALIKQTPPNDGVLNAVGKFGVTTSSYAFDIATMGDKNEGYLMAGDTLYTVSLETGKATMVTKIAGVTGAVRDIAVMPAM